MRTPRATIGAVIRVASGNFLEMYDFMVFGYYAPAIGKAFFPASSEFASLMLAFATFGAGFLMRPLGAVVLGAYVDRVGRRKGLLVTLALMSLGTLSIAFLPGYATIGIAAPLLVLAGRLVQGLSAGVELGGVSVYLAEIAPPGRTGFFVSWQSASQQVAVALAASLGVAVAALLPAPQVESFGWRIPLIVGCLIVPVLFVLRASLEETEVFRARTATPSFRETLATIARNGRIIALGVMLVTMTTVSFYFITAYTPTFGTHVLHLAPMAGLIVTLCVGVSNLVWLPLGGALSDRIGRRPVMLATTALAAASAYPALALMSASPSMASLLAVELWLSLLYGLYNGAMVAYLTEIVPGAIRTTAFSLAYSLATAVFGGFTPAIATYAIHASGNRALPGAWLTFAALLSLAATLLLGRRRPKSESRAV